MDKQQAWVKGRKLSDVVREYSNQRMTQAALEGDLVTWMQAYEHRLLTRHVENFSWIYGIRGFDNYSLDDFVAENFTDGAKQKATKEQNLQQKCMIYCREFLKFKIKSELL